MIPTPPFRPLARLLPAAFLLATLATGARALVQDGEQAPPPPPGAKVTAQGTPVAGGDAEGLGARGFPQKGPRLSELDYEVEGDIDAILGKPFEVGGQTITPADLKRAIVVGAPGRQVLESARLQVFIEEELERQKNEGVDVSKYQVSQEDLQAAISEAEELVKQEFPNDPQIQNPRDLYAMPETMWLSQLEQTQLFDRVFLPDDPREYPATTVAALNQSSPDFHDRLVEGHEERLRKAEEEGKDPAVDQAGQAMFRQLMRQIVIGALTKTAEVRSFHDGLPPEVALEVNGRPIKTEDVWRAIRWKVRDEDVEEARTWFVRTTLLRKDLEAKGAYMNDEQARQAYHDYTAPYADSPFNMEAVAVSFKKFPSPEHYKVHYRLQESFRRMIEGEINDESLQAHVQSRAGNLLGLAKVDVDVILIPAYDFRIQAFQEDGWEKATARAIECIQKLNEGMPWDQAVETYSEWYEPPVGKSSAANIEAFSRNKGRLGLKNRNELLQTLGESDWSLFLNGSSVTDYIFFELEVGVPSQPLRGPHGWYIAKVKRRTGPTSVINIDPEGHRNLVEQDYVTTRFNAYAQDLVAAYESARK